VGGGEDGRGLGPDQAEKYAKGLQGLMPAELSGKPHPLRAHLCIHSMCHERGSMCLPTGGKLSQLPEDVP